MQVFARSGKLKELIARAESQLETSPTSMQLLQTLVDYYQADNQRDKVKATYEKIAKLRPDDAKLRFQVGIAALAGGRRGRLARPFPGRPQEGTEPLRQPVFLQSSGPSSRPARPTNWSSSTSRWTSRRSRSTPTSSAT